MSATRLRESTFADTLHCYVDDPTHRRYRLAVECRLKMTATSYSETQYVLPKQMATSYVSYVDASGAADPRRRKWYRSSVAIHPATVSNVVVVGGFRWLEAVVVNLPVGHASSGFVSENDDDSDERL